MGRAIKRVIARQLDALMRRQGLTKTELAKTMKTSRAQLDRLLDPENESVTLGTLTRAAKAVGRNCGWSWCRRNKRGALRHIDSGVPRTMHRVVRPAPVAGACAMRDAYCAIEPEIPVGHQFRRRAES